MKQYTRRAEKLIWKIWRKNMWNNVDTSKKTMLKITQKSKIPLTFPLILCKSPQSSPHLKFILTAKINMIEVIRKESIWIVLKMKVLSIKTGMKLILVIMTVLQKVLKELMLLLQSWTNYMRIVDIIRKFQEGNKV